jgi:hypothetical protein
VAYVKKYNFRCSKFAIYTFVFLHRQQKCISPEYFGGEHRKIRYTQKKLFDILKCIFHNRCIWFYEPKHHVEKQKGGMEWFRFMFG